MNPLHFSVDIARFYEVKSSCTDDRDTEGGRILKKYRPARQLSRIRGILGSGTRKTTRTESAGHLFYKIPP